VQCGRETASHCQDANRSRACFPDKQIDDEVLHPDYKIEICTKFSAATSLTRNVSKKLPVSNLPNIEGGIGFISQRRRRLKATLITALKCMYKTSLSPIFHQSHLEIESLAKDASSRPMADDQERYIGSVRPPSLSTYPLHLSHS
jgi:hypothetical protein